MKSHTLSSLLILSIVLMSCASGKPQAEQEKVFKTKTVTTNFSLVNDGLSSGSTAIQYRVSASCTGSACTPTEARLVFSLKSSGSRLYLRDRSLSIHTSDTSFDWPGPEWRTVQEAPPVVGTVKTVTLPLKDLRLIGSAKDVTGNLSGTGFEWSYENREAIRELISRIKRETTSPE